MAKILERPFPEPEPRLPGIPPLANGDCLTRAEFERRYEAMPHLKKAELIEGVVYMPSPVSLRKHARPHYSVIVWLGFYSVETPGIIGADNATLRLDLDNEPQPDAFLIIDPELGGQAQIDDEDYLVGAPELIAEVSASSASYDLHQKLDVYRRNRVQEYIVWRVNDRQIDWFVWNKGRYEQLQPDSSGIFQSRVFPGLTLDSAALIDGDMKRVWERQKAVIASPAHSAFVKHLADAKLAAD